MSDISHPYFSELDFHSLFKFFNPIELGRVLHREAGEDIAADPCEPATLIGVDESALGAGRLGKTIVLVAGVHPGEVARITAEERNWKVVPGDVLVLSDGGAATGNVGCSEMGVQRGELPEICRRLLQAAADCAEEIRREISIRHTPERRVYQPYLEPVYRYRPAPSKIARWRCRRP